MNNFSDLSGAVFSWLEERCKPQLLQEAMYDVLSEVRQTYQTLDPALDSQMAQGGGGHHHQHHDVLAQLKQQQQQHHHHDKSSN